jgi:hypothetical protein
MRIFVSLLFGIPCIYLIWEVIRRFPISPFFIILALIFVPAMAAVSLLFGFAISKKTFDRRSYVAHRSFQLFGFKRERSGPIPKEGTIRLWSRWGDSDDSALWFHVDVNKRPDLAFCIAWKYDQAHDFAHELSEFLSYGFVDESPADHRARSQDRDARL